MADPVLHAGATIMCGHGASASIVASNARVKVGGQPVAVQTDTTTVAGCPLNVSGAPQPCLTVRWITAAVRVRVGGQPVLLKSSTGMGIGPTQAPQGPVNIVQAQPRVTAT